MRLLLLCLALAAAVSAVSAEVLTPKDLAAARKIYAAKCAKCHRFYEPTNYAETDWQAWMVKMSRKSKLKPEQETLVNRLLDAYRSGDLTGKPENARTTVRKAE